MASNWTRGDMIALLSLLIATIAAAAALAVVPEVRSWLGAQAEAQATPPPATPPDARPSVAPPASDANRAPPPDMENEGAGKRVDTPREYSKIAPRSDYNGEIRYCVSGLDVSAGFSLQGWPSPCRTRFGAVKGWHFHFFTAGPDGFCRECWDNVDNGCETVFLRDNPNFHPIQIYNPDLHRIDISACQGDRALPPVGTEVVVQ